MTVYYFIYHGHRVVLYRFIPQPAEWWRPVELTESYWIVPGTEREEAYDHPYL